MEDKIEELKIQIEKKGNELKELNQELALLETAETDAFFADLLGKCFKKKYECESSFSTYLMFCSINYLKREIITIEVQSSDPFYSISTNHNGYYDDALRDDSIEITKQEFLSIYSQVQKKLNSFL